MTTREEYAEAAGWHQGESKYHKNLSAKLHGKDQKSCLKISEYEALAARVLRALADGAVLCMPISKITARREDFDTMYPPVDTMYPPVDPQP
jgi:hypothetical protein